ncbi:hypothetical protein [uncultured Porphyromonas sp.]|uniref:TapB family protein n=1 Tax=uncultured Porphyromonas sp. TaxID=159274 RepID=UPI0005E13C90|nr:hypothetical protein [uncultured Porphyromonas sp.]CQB87936.1 Protein of uncharacterised function (DUF3108) [Chlamydia trachomatis]
MNKILAVLLLALTTLTASYAQYYDKEPIGTVYEYEMSNKLMGTSTITQTLKKVEGNVITFEVVTKVPGMKQPMTMENALTFADGKMQYSVESLLALSKNSMQQAGMGSNIDMSFDGEAGFTPLQGKVGDKLPLTKATITAKVQGMELNIITEMTRNEITAVDEEVTTPAGTFKTIKVEQDVKTTTQAMGMNQSQVTKQITWVVPNKGVVKTETTTMGQVMTTQLVKITRP